MGLLADRIGRKRVIATSIMGPILSLVWIVCICESCLSFIDDDKCEYRADF